MVWLGSRVEKSVHVRSFHHSDITSILELWKFRDYRGLKKRITAIRKAKENRPISPLVDPQVIIVHPDEHGELQTTSDQLKQTDNVGHQSLTPYSEEPEQLVDSPAESIAPGAVGFRGRTRFTDETPNSDAVRNGAGPSLSFERRESGSHSRDPPREIESTQRPEHPRMNTLNMGILPKLRRRSVTRPKGRSGVWDMDRSVPMIELQPLLTPVQKAFFDKLDSELDKVETFYGKQEKEMKSRVATLKQQLEELKDHRRLYHVGCSPVISILILDVPPF